ncbi:secretion system protein E, partial [Arthrobacter deserti]|nr:secretion system protein E [Arthrobacter deserti]
REALALQAGSALDLVIHLNRGEGGRRIQEIALLQPAGPGILEAVPALRGAAGGLEPGPGWQALALRLFPSAPGGKMPGP